MYSWLTIISRKQLYEYVVNKQQKTFFIPFQLKIQISIYHMIASSSVTILLTKPKRISTKNIISILMKVLWDFFINLLFDKLLNKYFIYIVILRNKVHIKFYNICQSPQPLYFSSGDKEIELIPLLLKLNNLAELEMGKICYISCSDLTEANIRLN